MSTIHEFDAQIYPRMLWVLIGGSVDDIKKRFVHVDYSEIDLSEWIECNEALCLRARSRKTKKIGELIWFIDPKSCIAPVIAHEATHAALDILTDVDVRLDPENQEPIAYLVGWIAHKVREVKLKLDIK